MSKELQMVLLVLAMAGITYIIRVLPMAFFRRKIKSQYLNSLLYYIPYAVLSAMTFPAIFYATGNIYTALAGTVVAIIAAISKRSLIIVAGLACSAVLIMNFII